MITPKTIDWLTIPNGGIDFKIVPGIYLNVPYETYAAWDACSRSDLEVIHKENPAKCIYKDQNPEDETPALLIGRAVHALVLEGEAAFEKQFVVSSTCFASTKEGSPCKNPGIIMIDGQWLCGVHCKGRLKYSIDDLVRRYVADGFVCQNISVNGSRYLHHEQSGRLLRISDHDPGAAGRRQMLRDGRLDIRADVPPHGNGDDRSILKPDQYEQIKGMVAALPEYAPVAYQFLYKARGANEVCLVWNDPETGLLCKARADAMRPYDGYAGDLKTCICAAPDEFANCMRSFGYGRQARHYLDGCEALELGIHEFVIIPMEKDPPYCPNLFKVGEATLEAATEDLRRAKQIYKRCKDSGKWPGYAEDQLIDVPRYELRRAMECAQTF